MKEKKKVSKDKSILIMTYSFVVIMLCLIINYMYFVLIESENVINNSYNKRSDILEERILRGNIFSADYEVLATTIESDDGKYSRYYPYGDVFAHVVGRYDEGKTGIELSHNYSLLKVDKYDRQTLVNEINSVKTKGYNVVTTLNTKLQTVAYNELINKKGAIVVIEPRTGKILTMVSAPSYDPNTVIDDWQILKENEDSPLLNRVTQGLYPPGSTFKVVTAMEYISQNKDIYDRYEFVCKGKADFHGESIACHNNKKHNTVNLYDSLAYSCNTSFANIGVNMDLELLRRRCEGLGFNIPLDLANVGITTGEFNLSNSSSVDEVLQTSIGQGKTLISPFGNALIMCAIENDGVLMQPYVVLGLCDDNKEYVKEYESGGSIEIIEEDIAKEMKTLLKGVTSKGTAKELSKLPYETYGKTGSAEYNSKGNAHAWFVGCAKVGGKEPIVICVLIEDGETGSKSAVPVAKRIITAYAEQ